MSAMAKHIERKRKAVVVSLTCVLLSMAFIAIVFGGSNINPLNTNWVTSGGGDNFQHYLGWRFFRISPWINNFLFMQNLNYPVGTSVIVTDSNPLFCLIFKLFRNVLPQDFQFNGIWIVFTWGLNAFFTSLIAWRLTKETIFTLFASAMVTLNPVILQRAMIHDTLTAHWLILAAIWLLMNRKTRWNPIGWGILVGISMLIHIYFLPMVGFILLLQMICSLRDDGRFIKKVVPFAASIVSFLGTYFFFGYNHILPQSGSYGELSMNLNAFINPDGTGRLLQSRATLPLQYEGYNYWGVGLIFLSILSVFMIGKDSWRRWRILLIPCLGLFFLAVSNIFVWDKTVLFQFDLPKRVYEFLSIFRSSGRLAWPFFYFALFIAVFGLNRFGKRSMKAHYLIITCCVIAAVLQIADLSPYIRTAYERFHLQASTDEKTFRDPRWEMMAENADHLFITEGESKEKDLFALFAVDHELTFNKSANARGIQPIFGNDGIDIHEMLSSDDKPERSIFVILDGTIVDGAELIDGFLVYESE